VFSSKNQPGGNIELPLSQEALDLQGVGDWEIIIWRFHFRTLMFWY